MDKVQYDVFVSYRRVSPDQEWVREQLVPALRHVGLKVLLDVDDFVPGRNLILEMTRANEESQRTLCVLSPEYFESGRMVQFESLTALADAPTGQDSRLIPMIVRPVALPVWLKNIVPVDWTVPAARQRQWLTLLAALGVDLTGDTQTSAQRLLPGPLPERVIPNNLPRQQLFVGRDEQLARIASVLAVETRGWGVWISGPGGIGKTTLAVRAAAKAPQRFRRVIFMSAKEMDFGPEGGRPRHEFVLHGYLEMLNAIARELGNPKLMQAPDAERPFLVRREIERSAVLLILDDFDSLPRDDRDRCLAFLSALPASCSAIVTGRRSRIDVQAVALRLDRLLEKDALDLLDKLAGEYPLLRAADGVQRSRLYQETAGNPLLMRWVAGQLGRGTCPTVDAALRFLRNAPANNDPLEYMFSEVLQSSPELELQLLALLSHFPNEMALELIVRLMRAREDVVEMALTALATRALLVPDVDLTRFWLAPMVSALIERQRPELVTEMARRVENRAYGLIVQNGYLHHEGYSTLEAEWPIILASLPMFLAGDNQRLQRICDALHIFLEFTGHWDEWLSLNEKAERKALDDGDYYEAGWRALQTGRVHRLRHQAEAVFACADRATEHWARTQSPDYRRSPRAGARENGDTLTLRGKAYYLKKDYLAAIDCFTQALAVLRDGFVETRDYASALNGLGDALRHSGNHDDAEKVYQEALAIARRIDSPNDIAAFTGNLAALAIDRRQFPQAEGLARDALKLAEQVGRQESIAADCRRLSEACAAQGKLDEGQRYARQAIEAYRRLGSTFSDIAESMSGQWKLPLTSAHEPYGDTGLPS